MFDAIGWIAFFCKISNGVLPASFVYEDEKVFGIMSLDQPNPYKVLVVPRLHSETIYDLPAAEAALIFQATVEIAWAVHDASACKGLNLVQSNGTLAGREVSHFHLHIVPRLEGDKIVLQWPAERRSRDALNPMAETIRSKMEER